MLETEVVIKEAIFHSTSFEGLKIKDFHLIQLPYLNITEICKALFDNEKQISFGKIVEVLMKVTSKYI